MSFPSLPYEVGSYEGWIDVKGVSVVGDLAYLADAIGGLLVLDVSLPSTPTFWGFYWTGTWNQGIAAGDRNVYLAEGDWGVEVFWECDQLVFTDGFESGDTSSWSATVP